MTDMLFADLIAVMPQLVLVAGMLTTLLVGVLQPKDQSFDYVKMIALSTFGFAIIGQLFVQTQSMPVVAFHGGFIRNDYTRFAKILVSCGGLTGILLAGDYLRRAGARQFEYLVLIISACLGMFIMISAGNFLALYVGAELSSLSLYILASFTRDMPHAAEAGLKYFILSALASGIMLYGISMLYGVSGTLDFVTMQNWLAAQSSVPFIATLGLVLVIIYMAFKLSAVPFHMWTPDVYEGAPTPVTAFFSLAPKVAGAVILIRLLTGPFAPLVHQWHQIIVTVSALSLILGAFAALRQTNLKRLLAYSAINHIGFLLLAMATNNAQGAAALLFYLAIYTAMSAGTFGLILLLQQQGEAAHEIADLHGLSQRRPVLALCLAIFMFAQAGVPPTAGFFSKMYVLLGALDAHLEWLAILGVLTSVVAAFYYLRIIKIMYFDSAEIIAGEPPHPACYPRACIELSVAIGASMIVTLGLILYPALLLNPALVAARALFP